MENLLEIYTKDHIEKTINCSVHLSLTKINFTALSINTRTAILLSDIYNFNIDLYTKIDEILI